MTVKWFLGDVGRNQTLATSPDPALRNIHTQAKSFEHDMTDVMHDVHRHWQRD